jgi:hypothetical protein
MPSAGNSSLSRDSDFWSRRQRKLLGARSKQPRPQALPAKQTQSDANVAAGDGIVAKNQSAVAKPDPVYQRFESVGRAESWKNEPKNHAGSFGPWPEEYE